MKFKMLFEQISQAASYSIMMNSELIYQGRVLPSYEFETTINGEAKLEIISDTTGSFELKHVSIDNESLDDILWDYAYFTEANTSSINLGGLHVTKPGKIVLEVTSPVTPWLTERKHKKYKSDPALAEDFNYYITACQLLDQIQN